MFPGSSRQEIAVCKQIKWQPRRPGQKVGTVLRTVLCLAPKITLVPCFLKTTVLNYNFCWEEVGSRNIASSICPLEFGPKLDLLVGRANCSFWLLSKGSSSRLLIHYTLPRRLKMPLVKGGMLATVPCWGEFFCQSHGWITGIRSLSGWDTWDCFWWGERKEAGPFLSPGRKPWVVAKTVRVQGQEIIM